MHTAKICVSKFVNFLEDVGVAYFVAKVLADGVRFPELHVAVNEGRYGLVRINLAVLLCLVFLLEQINDDKLMRNVAECQNCFDETTWWRHRGVVELQGRHIFNNAER